LQAISAKILAPDGRLGIRRWAQGGGLKMYKNYGIIKEKMKGRK
jgi:hypothetical protein